MKRTTTGFLLALLFAISVPQSTLGQLQVITKSGPNVESTYGDSLGIELNEDGRWAVFYGMGNALATNANDELNLDLFLRDNQSGQITLITRSINGGSADESSYQPNISPDGRYVVFASDATDLVEGDDNEESDLFLYDRETDQVSIITTNSANGIADAASGNPVMSRNGKFVIFESEATNLLDEETTGPQLYLYDMETKTITLLSMDAEDSGAAIGPDEAPTGDWQPSISADGGMAAFASTATNLVAAGPFAEETEYFNQIYARNIAAGSNILVSVSDDGVPANADSYSPLISGDGRVIAYLTTASNLPGSDPDDQMEKLFLYNVETGLNTRLPYPEAILNGYRTLGLSEDGAKLVYTFNNKLWLWEATTGNNLDFAEAVNKPKAFPEYSDISPDGRYILFTSNVEDAEIWQLYSYDTTSAKILLLSRNSAGEGADANIDNAVLSGNGLMAGFGTKAGNLTTNDNALYDDVFTVSVVDPEAGASLVSTATGAAPSVTANGASRLIPIIARNGRSVVFESGASTLTSGDDNNRLWDIFLGGLTTGTVELVTKSPDGLHSQDGFSTPTAISDDGRFLLIESRARNLTDGARTNLNLFLYDSVLKSNRLVNLGTNGEIVLGFNSFLSRDGSTISYDTGSKTFIRNVISGEARIDATAFKTIQLSPHGRYLVKNDARNSYLVNTSDGTSTVLARDFTFAQAITAFFSDNESTLLYEIQHGGTRKLVLRDIQSGAESAVIENAELFRFADDGSVVIYQSGSEDENTENQPIFVYDLASGSTSQIEFPGGIDSLPPLESLSITSDGQTIAFGTKDARLSRNGETELFIFDRAGNSLTRLTTTIDGEAPNGPSAKLTLSDDGSVAVFESDATNLVPNDRNFSSDIFVVYRPALKASVADGVLELQFRGAPGSRYQLQFADSIGSEWSNLGDPFTAAGDIENLPLGSDGAEARFFRVISVL